MAYEDYENEEESEDEEENEESSESSETQASINTPAPTPANNQPIDTAIKAGQEAQQPTAPAQQPATPGQTSTLPNDSPYTPEGQTSGNASDNQTTVYNDFATQWANATDKNAQQALLTQFGIDKMTPEQAAPYIEAIKATQGKNTPTTPGTQALTSSYYNSINIDPNKTYGQVNSGRGYVYSYDAKQLQNDINRAIFDYNKKIANGTIEGKTAADYIKPLKVDGMYGSKTKDAISKLQQAGYNVTNFPASVGGDYSNGNSGASQSGSSTSSDNNAVQKPIGSTTPAVHTPSAPSGDSAYWDANREAAFRDRQLAEINAKGQSMNEYYGNLLEALRNQESYQNRDNNTGTEWNQPGTGFGTGNFAGRSVMVPDGGDKASSTPRSTTYDNAPVVGDEDANLHDLIEEANRRAESGYLMGTPSAPTEDSAYWNTREPERTQEEREPINYNAMADELFQMNRNDWYQRPENQQANEVPEREPINYGALTDELNQLDRNDWYQRPETTQTPERIPLEYSDAFIRQQDMNDAYSPNQTFNDSYMAQLERMQEQPNQPIEYSDAFIRQQNQMDAYSPYADYSGSMASDDIQSSGMTSTPRQLTRAEGVSQVGDSMSRALADNQAQPTTNIFAQDAPPVISPERENQYKTLFNNEINALSQMYPDASFSQLYDYLNLFYQQNGDTDTEYYRWFNSFL